MWRLSEMIKKIIEISWEELTEEYLNWERKQENDPDEIDYDEMYNLDVFVELDFHDE